MLYEVITCFNYFLLNHFSGFGYYLLNTSRVNSTISN